MLADCLSLEKLLPSLTQRTGASGLDLCILVAANGNPNFVIQDNVKARIKLDIERNLGNESDTALVASLCSAAM